MPEWMKAKGITPDFESVEIAVQRNPVEAATTLPMTTVPLFNMFTPDKGFAIFAAILLPLSS
jgi:hypothetical protein